MLTTSCPKCEKEVSVPVAAKAESRVRCPLCAEEYTLESVFADIPPLLELLDAPATNGAPATIVDEAKSDDTVVEEDKDAGGMFDFDQGESSAESDADDAGGIAIGDPADTDSKAGSFDFGGDDAPAAATVGGTSTTARKPRPRKKSASPLKAIIGVVIGGIAAIPIAQLTLWYLPGGWDIGQRDPMGVGETLTGTWAGFIVPSWVSDAYADETVSTATPEVETPTTNTSGQDDDSQADPDEPADGLGGMLGTAHNNNGNKRGNQNGNNKRGGNGNKQPPDENDNANDGEDSGSGDEVQPPPAAGPGVKDAPVFTKAELGEELKVVKEEAKQLPKVTDRKLETEVRLAALDDFVAAASRLAEVTTFVDERPQGFNEHLDEILADAGDSPLLRRYINQATLMRIDQEDRSNDGVIVSGEIEEIQKRGQLFETVIKVEDPDNRPLSVYGPRDPSGAFHPGETVMILGVIIDKPLDELRGYKGPPDPVIWGGYSRVVTVEGE